MAADLPGVRSGAPRLRTTCARVRRPRIGGFPPAGAGVPGAHRSSPAHSLAAAAAPRWRSQSRPPLHSHPMSPTQDERPAGFGSIEEIQETFRAFNYIADRSISTAVFLALELGRPL